MWCSLMNYVTFCIDLIVILSMLFIVKVDKNIFYWPPWKIQMKKGFLHVVLIGISDSGPLAEKDRISGLQEHVCSFL